MTDAEAIAILDELCTKAPPLRVGLAVRHVKERLTLLAASEQRVWSAETVARAEAMGVELTSQTAPHDAYRCTDPACSCGQKEGT